MNEVIESCVAGLNEMGGGFCDFAGAMLVQSGLLVVLLLIVDVVIRKRVRATVRYWLWILVFAKLLLPPTLSLPTGIGSWGPEAVSIQVPALEPMATDAVRREAAPFPTPKAPTSSALSPTILPSDLNAETTSPTPAVVAASTQLTWQAVLLLLWVVGVLIFGVIVIQRVLFVRGLMAQSGPADPGLLEALASCRRRLGVRRDIALRVSPQAFSPAVCGLFRPTILVPSAVLEKLSVDDLRAVLIHEVAHIKRGDLWLHSAQTLLQIVYFYNPFVWLAGARVRGIRERAVDETVLVALGAEAGSYSRTLIDIAEMTFFRPNPALRLIGVAESKKSLEGRIKHMMTRPIPKTAKIGLAGFLAVLIGAAVLLPMARGRARSNASSARDGYAIVLLDNADPDFKGKSQYDDRLYLLDPDGNVKGAVSGLNICETMGGAHMLAVDARRQTLWVVENVGGRLWHIDLATGQVKRKISGFRASAVAVDPATGNAWVVIPGVPAEKSRVVVVAPSGRVVAEHAVDGFDIAYSEYDDSFWVVGKDVHRIGKTGRVLGRITGQIPAWAISVSVDQKAGNAWVVVRAYPGIAKSKPELWAIDKNMRIQKRIDLGDLIPSCVFVDSDQGIVLAGCLGTTLRFTTAGKKLRSARYASGFSVVPGRSRNEVFAADRYGLCSAVVETSGAVSLGEFANLRDRLGSSQKWLALVPFAGAKLQSSPELADLTRGPRDPQEVAPLSTKTLSTLGKALLIHANDYEDKFPDSLRDLHEYLSDGDLAWLGQNVTYLGKGLTVTAHPETAVAYDKTLIEKREGTTVLYLDSHVAFEEPDELERLKIRPAIQNLKRLALAALIYASDHDDTLAGSLDELEPYLASEKPMLAWVRGNVEYVGGGVKMSAEGAGKPIAYERPGPASDFIAVAFMDGHVERARGPRLKELGIETRR